MDEYQKAGVDLGAADAVIGRYQKLAAKTNRPGVLEGIGGFAGLFELSGYQSPVLVSATDGVGTKVKLARDLNRLTTVGQDLVAMCVNDVLCHGAQPLFFLDYLGTGKLEVEEAEAIVAGVADGCVIAGCALLGGETAEMPGIYQERDFDLAGFAVGVVEREAVLGAALVCPGDVLIGLPSSGLHSNGYSLVRHWLGRSGIDLAAEQELADALMQPTRIYVKPILAALAAGGVHALAHITGGGIPSNLARLLGDRLDAEIDITDVPLAPVYTFVRQFSRDREGLLRTFNMGIGMILAVEKTHVGGVLAALTKEGESPLLLGAVRDGMGLVQCALRS